MLHKSFKSTKCKTSLKLATSRIKLLKNKKGVQLKQMRRELAQLLESGQDRTARIRVEHVIREEKTIAAYDLIEIYCELIAARLPIIESQKNCPIDLKEAITSVIFASPRCADIPELQEARKHFTAKYGKEFITAAVELRPDCGVGRMLVEKLSAVAPDVQTKVKVLSSIAEEHNIKWDPDSFAEKESKPPDDLLNGPNTFEKASKMHAEPPSFQAPNVQPPPSRDQKHDASLNFSEQNTRPSLGTQNTSSIDSGSIRTTSSATHHPGLRPSGTGAEKMEVRQSFPGDGNAFSLGRKNWNMEFKDATSAAQAAAEAAEQASMAARAAAELSSQGRISRQYSTESQKLNIHGLTDEGAGKYEASKFSGEHLPKDSVNNSFVDRNPKLNDEQRDGNEHDNLPGAAERFYWESHGGIERSSQVASLRSRKASIDDDALVNSVQKADGYSQKSSFEEEAIKADKGPFASEMIVKEQSRESKVEFVSGQQEGFKSANFDYFGEERIRKQTSTNSSRSHSSNFGDDYNVFNSNEQKFGNDVTEEPFVDIDQGSIHRDTMKTSSYDADAVVFDGSDSGGDSCRFDIGPNYDEGESKSYFPSPGRKSPIHPSANTDAWSPRRNVSNFRETSTSQPHFPAEWHSSPKFYESSTKSVDFSQPEDFVPVTFDDSDAPNSGSEDELEMSRLSGTKDSGILLHKRDVYSLNPEPTESDSHGLTESSFVEKRNSISDTRPWSRFPSDDLDSMEAHPRNQVMELNADSSNKFDLGESLASQTNSESAELNFGTLTGGRRNKVYRHPPYTRGPSGDASSLSKKVDVETSTTIEQTSAPSGRSSYPLHIRGPSGDVPSSSKIMDEESSMTTEWTTSPSVGSSFNLRVSRSVEGKSSSQVPIISSDSDTDDSEEEFPEQTLISRQEPYAQKANKKVNTKPSLRAPVTYFGPDSGDTKENPPKQTSTSKGSLGSGFSRRTKASPSSSETSSFSEVRVGSEASVNSKSSVERKPTSSSYGSATPPQPQSRTGSSGQWESQEQPSSGQAASKPMPESMISSREGSLKASAVESPSSFEASSYSKVRVRSEASVNSSSSAEGKPAWNSYSSETPTKHWSQTGSSDHWQSPEEPGSAKQAASKPMPELKISSRERSLKASAVESPSSFEASSYSRVRVGSEASVNSSSSAERKPARSSYSSETPPKPRSQTVSSGQWESHVQSSSAKQAATKPMPESKFSSREGTLKASAVEKPSSPLRKTIASGSTEKPNASTLSGETSTTENTAKKASHVHPKLPDYDTIAAQLQSLRNNRQ